jgi:hypothetical protein
MTATAPPHGTRAAWASVSAGTIAKPSPHAKKDGMVDLKLPSTYEDAETALGGPKHVNAKLMQFVQPVEATEHELAEIVGFMQNSGKLVFLLGRPGVGKSTFIQSLSWRTHLRLSDLQQFDASKYPTTEALTRALEDMRVLGHRASQRLDVGVAAIAINYLENLAGVPLDQVRAFFRSLNGLLRNNRLLVLWPVTVREDAESMLAEASRISGTLFHPGKEIVEFEGPLSSAFPTIAANTIAVMNDGRRLEDFSLTPEDLEELLAQTKNRGQEATTIRNYLQLIRQAWSERTNQLIKIRTSVPKPTEIWFVLSHRNAEGVADQFARKSVELDEAWRANHSKLYEYIHNNQREADWNAKRLQFAIGGAFTCRILYMPTSTLVSVVGAYGAELGKTIGLREKGVPKDWLTKSGAKKLLGTTPLIRQLRGDPVKFGKRRSGSVAGAIQKAQVAYQAISTFATGEGGGSDVPLNRALAAALRDVLPDSFSIVAQEPHPWLPHVIPDILVDTPQARHICIEMFYSNRVDPYVAADYVLRKLDRYMRQLESKVDKKLR